MAAKQADPRSWKVGCKTTESEPWAYNALRFPTKELAQAYFPK